jgi:hypothetical protein
MKQVLFWSLLAIILTAEAPQAQVWRSMPQITVISPADDPRLRDVDEAVAFWNSSLREIGSGLRLGPITRLVRPIPETALRLLHASLLSGRGQPANFRAALGDLPGDITIFLAESDFISFISSFDESFKTVIAIKGTGFPPLNLPNVPRNVIAHELGLAIGLKHNSDPSTLMCGRPAPCRPNLFRSDQPRFFPLTQDEKRWLLTLYPAQWPTQSASVPVVGFLHSGSADQNGGGVNAFKKGLADAGFAAGSVAIEFRWANLNSARLPALAADLVDHQVAVLFASNSKGPLRAAKAATASIPIVFFYGGDPVQDGFAASLNRPGGNMTGVTALQYELAGKRVQILHELIPQATTIAL